MSRQTGGRRSVRAVLVALDQVAVSGSNFLPVLLFGRVSSAADFARFSGVLLFVALILELQRAAVGEVLLARFAGGTSPADASAERGAISTSLGAAIALAAVCAGVLFLLGLGPLGLVLVGVLPVVMVEDACRYIGFRRDRVAAVALADWIWFLAVLLSFGVISEYRSVAFAVALWGTGGLAALGVLVSLGLSPRPSVTKAFGFLRSNGALGGQFGGEVILATGTNYAGLALLGMVGGSTGFATVRAGQLVCGPVTIVLVAAVPFGVPLARAAFRTAPERYEGFVLRLGAALGTFAAAAACALIVVPDSVGEALLGRDRWVEVAAVRWALLPYLLATSASVALKVGLRAIEGGREGLRARAYGGVLQVALPPLGYLLFGARGAFIALATATSAINMLVFAGMRRRTARLLHGADSASFGAAKRASC